MPAMLALLRGACALLLFPAAAAASTPEPYEGQPGKDVVWVPTPQALVE